MSGAAVSELIAVGGGITTDLTRSEYVGAGVGDVRIRHLERRNDSAQSGGRWRGGRDGRNGRKILVRMAETR